MQQKTNDNKKRFNKIRNFLQKRVLEKKETLLSNVFSKKGTSVLPKLSSILSKA